MENNQVVELEKALIGAILVNEKAFHNVKGRLAADDFFDNKNKIIFQAISNVYDKGFEDIELAPIVNELLKNKQLDQIGGEEYLAVLMNQPGLESNITKYMQEISSKADLRRVKDRLSKIQKELETSTNANADDVLERLEVEVLNTTRGTDVKEFVDAKTGINETIADLERKAAGEQVSGITVDLPSLDKMTGGFQKGDLIILAARPSMGKTALALNMAANASKRNNVAFFSLEMPMVQLYNRILSATAFIDGNKFRESKLLTDNEWKKITFAKEQIEKMNLYIDDTAGIKLSELVWKAKKLHKNKGLDFIVIDYLQLIVASSGGSDDNRQAEVSAISRTLKKLARDLNIPVIALSQLSRKVEQREDKRPMMSDLRESGAIEQDADLIAFVYRENYYKKQEEKDEKEMTDVIIAKHRNGAIGTVRLFFKPEHGLFIEKGANQ